MAHQVQATALVERQIRGLRGPTRAAFETFTGDLARRGCAALGYRLTGQSIERLCVHHLRGRWRVVVAFDAAPVVWVVLVAQHTGEAATNVYDLLYALTGQRPELDQRRTKPACCDDQGAPPLVDEALITSLTRRTRQLSGRARR